MNPYKLLQVAATAHSRLHHGKRRMGELGMFQHFIMWYGFGYTVFF